MNALTPIKADWQEAQAHKGRAMPSARATAADAVEPVPVSSKAGVSIAAVTQADRDAAAAYMDRVKSTRWSIGGILSGGCDNTSVVQAFASHRQAASNEFLEALRRVQDEANTVCGDWRETASMIDSICIAALAKAGVQ